MTRPMRQRIWFYGPEWFWPGWRGLIPFGRGGDEYDWHTIVLGWHITGQVVIATRRCPQTGRCADGPDLVPDWPHTVTVTLNIDTEPFVRAMENVGVGMRSMVTGEPEEVGFARLEAAHALTFGGHACPDQMPHGHGRSGEYPFTDACPSCGAAL